MRSTAWAILAIKRRAVDMVSRRREDAGRASGGSGCTQIPRSPGASLRFSLGLDSGCPGTSVAQSWQCYCVDFDGLFESRWSGRRSPRAACESSKEQKKQHRDATRCLIGASCTAQPKPRGMVKSDT